MNASAPAIDLTADIIDVRDIIARVEHLEQIREPGPVDLGDDDNESSQDDLFAELAMLEHLLNDLRGEGGDEKWRGDWYPLTLIADSYFREYARNMAEDCASSREEADLISGEGRGSHWPFTCMAIDWERAASELKQDYSGITIGCFSYWYR